MNGPATEQRSRRSGRWAAVFAAVAAAVLIAGGAVWLQSDGDGRTAPDVGGPVPGIPADALSPAGSPLPDGFTVPQGADLVATPMRYQLPHPEATPEWQAVLLVNDDPIATWSALLRQMAMVLGTAVDADNAEGCGVFEEQLECLIYRSEPNGPGVELSVSADLETVPGDVTGHYTIRLLGERTTDLYENPIDPWPGGDPPPAPGARPRPDMGDPLATQTLADPADYPLLEGSELLVQYSNGSLTGGFGVLLRVLPGADVDAVGWAYAEQASQFDEPIEEQVTETDGATVTVYVPPGGAGGYQGTVYAVDNDSGADYVYYELSND